MSKLPQDVGLAFERARALYTPSPERLARIEARVAQAVQQGAGPAVDVPQALFVPATPEWRRYRWGLPYWMAFVAVATLGLKYRSVLWDVPEARESSVAAPERDAAPEHDVEAHGSAREQPEAPPAVATRPAEPVSVALARDAAAGELATAPASKRVSASKKKLRDPTRLQVDARASDRVQKDDAFGPAFDLPESTAPVEVREPKPAQASAQGGAAQSRVTPGKFSAQSNTAQSNGLLAAEVQLISQAQKALGKGDVARVQALLSQHRREFPAGQLLAERVALEALAHCRLEDAAGAEQALRQLTLLAPDSQLLRRAKQKCGEWSAR